MVNILQAAAIVDLVRVDEVVSRKQVGYGS
jgi:hypothetical protein